MKTRARWMGTQKKYPGMTLEKWLDDKKETDMWLAINETDPYVPKDNDIFDEYRGEDNSIDDLYDEVMNSGVDTREPQY